MKHPLLLRRSVLFALLPLALGACHHDNNRPDEPKTRIELPTLASGAHTVVVDGDGAAHDGTAFIGSKGAAYVVLGVDSNQAATVVYRRASSTSAWRRVPEASTDLQLSGKLDEAQTITAWTTSPAAHVARLGDINAPFSLTTDGTLTASGDGCKLSGRIATADLANAASATLKFSGCAASGAPDGDYDGIAYVDPEAPNAAFHVVVDNGSTIRDFYVYGS